MTGLFKEANETYSCARARARARAELAKLFSRRKLSAIKTRRDAVDAAILVVPEIFAFQVIIFQSHGDTLSYCCISLKLSYSNRFISFPVNEYKYIAPQEHRKDKSAPSIRKYVSRLFAKVQYRNE